MIGHSQFILFISVETVVCHSNILYDYELDVKLTTVCESELCVNINALPHFTEYNLLKKILCSQISFVYPSNFSLNVLNCFSCRGLVNSSAIIIDVGECVTSNSPESIYCFMKKYLSFICFVRSKHDFLLKASLIGDVLSWYN